MTFKLTALPASDGDCLLLSYGSFPARHVLIDGGRISTYSFLKPVLRKIVESNEQLELLVLTHIDADHIEGLLPLVAEDELGLDIKEIWFNGYDQLFDFETLGFAQADALSDALRAKGLKPNDRFGGSALMIPENGPLPRIKLDGGMSLTLLSPDRARLDKLQKEWAMWRGTVQATPKPDAVGVPGLEILGRQPIPSVLDVDLLSGGRERENIFEHVLEAAGRQPFAKITTAIIMAGRDRRAKTTPAQARKFLDTMRGLFRWALKAKLLKVDPTAGVANPSAPNSDGFTPWSIEDITAYEARWPIGTRQRVWLDVLVYTGLRRGDAVRFGRQHIRNGIGTIKTEKTDIVVTLPILPVLMKTLDAGPSGDLTFIAGEGGRPLTKESFGNLFRKACREAGLQNRSAHGLRKAAATRAAENGATVAQLNAIFGWKGAKMATLYTEAADRRRLSIDAMHLLATTSEHSIPSPTSKVRAREPKQQTNQR